MFVSFPPVASLEPEEAELLGIDNGLTTYLAKTTSLGQYCFTPPELLTDVLNATLLGNAKTIIADYHVVMENRERHVWLGVQEDRVEEHLACDECAIAILERRQLQGK